MYITSKDALDWVRLSDAHAHKIVGYYHRRSTSRTLAFFVGITYYTKLKHVILYYP
jgi:hypothetical protein